jgi:hypothetical protein
MPSLGLLALPRLLLSKNLRRTDTALTLPPTLPPLLPKKTMGSLRPEVVEEQEGSEEMSVARTEGASEAGSEAASVDLGAEIVDLVEVFDILHQSLAHR